MTLKKEFLRRSEVTAFNLTTMTIPSVSRAELLQWINGVLDTNYTKIEQCGTGAIYCQLLDSIYRMLFTL